jgi:8-oxo-dGTP diphosphatase
MIVRQFVAMKAFIEFDGRILLLRDAPHRSNPGRFDAPGGRVEPGEMFLDALRREIREETGLEVRIDEPFFVGEWRPVVRGEQWQIVGTFFACTAASDDVKVSDEHDRFIWILPSEYRKFDIVKPLDEAFRAFLARKR